VKRLVFQVVWMAGALHATPGSESTVAHQCDELRSTGLDVLSPHYKAATSVL
jgi:hypothetical protein